MRAKRSALSQQVTTRHKDIWFAWKTHKISMHHLPEHVNQDITRRWSKDKDSTVNKLNTRAKEIQQVNPGRTDKQPKHQTPTISPIEKSESRNCHRVWSSTHRRAIKEKSKVANGDWVDHQVCSLLQCINVKANPFIMGNYFDELRWKIIRDDNLLQFIHQVTIEFRFRTVLIKAFVSLDMCYHRSLFCVAVHCVLSRFAII